MVLRTALTEALGIRYPLIQGGMHYVGYASLAAAVSNAGGLGLITALTQPNPEALRREIRKCRELTDKTFGVNITLLPVGTKPDFEGIIRVVVEEKIKVVETAGRNPEKVIRALKEQGIYVIHKCVAIRHALTAQRHGADMISMDGFECGGHPGEEDVGNWILLAKAGKQLTIPFVASGGCGDGTQLAAALSMGACGINMGTRFMATKEAPIHDNIKQAMVKADERSTTLVLRSLKNTERVFKNSTSMKVRELEAQNPGEIGPIYPYLRGENYRKSFQETGDVDSSVWSCGQVLGLINDIPTCAELCKRIHDEAEATILRLHNNNIVGGAAKL
eukprot:TRINITY_DN50921_c0_g1_i1.p1 TRINITY_DN50921_c0_g1~~TRINITY_DN50921_c0_g1_i1.p1  ORF type:complete len:333 (+),score=148.71 TRINITY_DN50921_c0_g1_i1:60-1058(+)